MSFRFNSLIVLYGVTLLLFCIGSSAKAQSNENGQALSSRRGEVLSDRERRFIESTAGRDFDQLFEAISQPDGENSLIVYWSAMQPSATGASSVPFRAVLADRRVAKIFELLAAMPRDEASRRISQVFEDKFERFTTNWGKPMEGGGGRTAGEARHGLAASLFLCLEFCGDEQFNNGLQQWADWAKAKQSNSGKFIRRAGPDELMVINFYAIALIKNGMPLTEINQRVHQLCDDVGIGRLPVLKIQRFYKWNTGGKMYDDPNNVLAEYPVFFDWGLAIQLPAWDSETQSIGIDAMAKARDWVRPPGPIEQWLEFVWQQLVEWANTWLRME